MNECDEYEFASLWLVFKTHLGHWLCNSGKLYHLLKQNGSNLLELLGRLN